MIIYIYIYRLGTRIIIVLLWSSRIKPTYCYIMKTYIGVKSIAHTS